jgi:predicted metal-binding membrane protein
MPAAPALERILARDRSIVAAGLVIICVLSWAYTIYLAWSMAGMDMEMDMSMAMPQVRAWSAVELALLFVMWLVMMVAMMTPSAAPMILLFAMINRKRKERAAPYVPTAIFLGGYLLVWAAFSAAATAGQWQLHRMALLSPMMASTSAWLGGGILVAAGLFQWLPLKGACLRHCRSPLSFLTTRWREGSAGALAMGVEHGAYCAGCCWALMALLFVGGVMNLFWIAGLTILVLLEKAAPWGDRLGKAAGLLLVLGGSWLAVSAY